MRTAFGFIDTQEKAEIAAKVLTEVMEAIVTVDDLPRMFSIIDERNAERRQACERKRRCRDRVRLNDPVLPFRPRKTKSRVRLHNAAIIEFGPTRQQQLTEAFARIGGVK